MTMATTVKEYLAKGLLLALLVVFWPVLIGSFLVALVAHWAAAGCIMAGDFLDWVSGRGKS